MERFGGAVQVMLFVYTVATVIALVTAWIIKSFHVELYQHALLFLLKRCRPMVTQSQRLRVANAHS